MVSQRLQSTLSRNTIVQLSKHCFFGTAMSCSQYWQRIRGAASSDGYFLPSVKMLAPLAVLLAAVALVTGQEDGQAPEQPNYIQNLIPQVPMPAWVSPGLSSFPSNIPGAPTYQFPKPPEGQYGGAGGLLSGLAGAAGGSGGLGSLLSGLAGGTGGTAGGLASLLPMIMSGAPPSAMYPIGDPRNCLRGNPGLNILHVVPGIGWDNLRNTETGLLTSFSYSQCKVTYDRKYLIPDETFAIPIKTSEIERQAELFDHWDSYKSVTARSINAEFDFFGKIGGKFSNEYQRVKSKQYQEKAVTMRVEMRHKFYIIKQLPDVTLHPGFKARLLEILSLLKSNDTELAEYSAQMLVRDYGTHCLTSIEAGAVLIKEDNLRNTVLTRYSGRADSITTAAGVDLYDMLKVKASAGFSNYNGASDLKAYRNNRTSSRLYTYGGPPFRLGMNLSEWERNLMNNLVATDRSGKPIHTLITSQSLQPEATSSGDVYVLKQVVMDAVSEYYDYNTHIGCTNPKAPNFDYQANDGTVALCKEPSYNYTFGGVFQKCSSNGNTICGDLLQKNPLTGDYSCPANFRAVLIQYGTERKGMTKRSCRKKRKCYFLGIFNCHMVDVCNNVPFTEVARVESYWCASKRKANSKPTFGYMFGGLYSNEIQNPITKSRSCPQHFISLKLGADARVCVSEDYELGVRFALPFGGFFSCISGNMLAPMAANEYTNKPKDWPMRCPGGFTQHLAWTERSCRVNYCVKAGSLLRAADLELVLPPFESRPFMKPNSTMNLYTPNVTATGPRIQGVPIYPQIYNYGAIAGGSNIGEGNGASQLQPALVAMVIVTFIASML